MGRRGAGAGLLDAEGRLPARGYTETLVPKRLRGPRAGCRWAWFTWPGRQALPRVLAYRASRKPQPPALW